MYVFVFLYRDIYSAEIKDPQTKKTLLAKHYLISILKDTLIYH